jgi:uncharacterized protein YndB with AHSA1/START domain
MSIESRGRFERIEGRIALRFERQLSYPPDRVWSALTTPAAIAAWFPCRIDGQLTTTGSALSFVFSGSDDAATTGKVLAAEPARSLRFTWIDDELRFALEPARGGTALTFIDLMPDDFEPAAARTAAGWHVCLDSLIEHLATGNLDPPSNEADENFRAVYDLYVADGLPNEVPLPGR